MMLGEESEFRQKPKSKIIFVEDLTESQKQKLAVC